MLIGLWIISDNTNPSIVKFSNSIEQVITGYNKSSPLTAYSRQLTTPLHMIISGSAGTGKVYLISAIAHKLGTSCVLLEFIICAQTFQL